MKKIFNLERVRGKKARKQIEEEEEVECEKGRENGNREEITRETERVESLLEIKMLF